MSAVTKHDSERVIDMRNNTECWKLVPEFGSQANLFLNSSQGPLGISSSQWGVGEKRNFRSKICKTAASYSLSEKQYYEV